MKKLLLFISIQINCFGFSFAQYGNGSDGVVTIDNQVTFITTINNYGFVTNVSGNDFTIDDASGFTVGNLVMVHQHGGSNEGVYEIKPITAVAGNVVSVSGLDSTFLFGGNNIIQLITVPQYQKLIVKANNLIYTTYNQSANKGGVCVFYVRDSLIFEDATHPDEYGSILVLGRANNGQIGYGGIPENGFGGQGGSFITNGGVTPNYGTGRNGGGAGGFGGLPDNSVTPAINDTTCNGCGSVASNLTQNINRIYLGAGGYYGNGGNANIGSGGGGGGESTSGTNGDFGSNGGNGGSGGNGGGAILAMAKKIVLPPNNNNWPFFWAVGGNATSGLNAVSGGEGGKGGDATNCNGPRGGGGNGGDGGNGGNGGSGGAGGFVGILTGSSITNFSNSNINVMGGSGGFGGGRGNGGKAGVVGSDGNNSNCYNYAGALGDPNPPQVNINCSLSDHLNMLFNMSPRGNGSAIIDSSVSNVWVIESNSVNFNFSIINEDSIRMESIEYNIDSTIINIQIFDYNLISVTPSANAPTFLEAVRSILYSGNSNYTISTNEIIIDGFTYEFASCNSFTYNLGAADGNEGQDGLPGNNGANGSFDIVFQAPLPVSWLAFEAKNEAYNVALNWATSSELNCHFFEVQKSENGISYQAIGKVMGNGTTNKVSHYLFLDNAKNGNITYYRLKQFDFDGSFAFSETRIVKQGAIVSSATIWPNPTTDKLFVKSQNIIKNIQIRNTFGQIIVDLMVDTNRIEIETQSIKNGFYILKLSGDGFEQVSKFIKN